MKRIVLLCAFAALMAACGGAEESAEQPAAEPVAEVNLEFGSLTDATEYLLANYSEEQLKEMFLEFSALSKADSDYYFEKDEDGNYIEAEQAVSDEILAKMSENIDGVIKRFGISQSLFAALMRHSATTDWAIEMEEQIATRAQEILAKRSESN